MNASEFGCGAAHQLAITAVKAGWELKDFTALTQSEEKCREVLDFLRGDKVIVSELSPDDWTIDGEGNIHFTVTSNNFSLKEWKSHSMRRGWRFDIEEDLYIFPTNNVRYHVVVIRSDKTRDHYPNLIYAENISIEKGLKKPHWEVAPLIRDKFPDGWLKSMDLWSIFVMHEPIIIGRDCPCILSSSREGEGRGLYLTATNKSGSRSKYGGFAFVEFVEQQ